MTDDEKYSKILDTLAKIAYDHAKYKSTALESLMVSMYGDFLDIKDKLNKIEHKQAELERLIASLDGRGK